MFLEPSLKFGWIFPKINIDMEQRDEPEDDLRADRSLWQIVDDVYDDTLHLAERDKAVKDLRA